MSATRRSRPSSRSTRPRSPAPGRRPRPRAEAGVADALNICLVSPYALAGGHPVAEYVRNEATGLAGRGHGVTVLAPSASSQSLRSGRRRLRSLAAGDAEALHALPGEPLAVAVGPAVPSRARGRGRGAGLPIAASANVAMAVGEGGFDIVHAHEPIVPGLATAALRHTLRVGQHRVRPVGGQRHGIDEAVAGA